MSFFPTLRRHWLCHHAAATGTLRRSAIVEKFGVSTAQASKDINEYLQDFPDALAYDKTAKTYRWTGKATPPTPIWDDLSASAPASTRQQSHALFKSRYPGGSTGAARRNKAIRREIPGGNPLLDLLEIVHIARTRGRIADPLDFAEMIEDRLQQIRDEMEAEILARYQLGPEHPTPPTP